MSAVLLTPPAAEPITLAEAKAYLRVANADDDDVIAALVSGARAHLEATARRALVTQTWRLVRDAWPADGRIIVTPGPLRQAVAARIYRADGTTQTIDVSAFTLDTGADVIVLPPGSLTAPGRAAAGIEIDVEVGYGVAADVPEPLRQALRQLVAHWYENRGLAAIGHDLTLLPASVATLIAPFRGLAL